MNNPLVSIPLTDEQLPPIMTLLETLEIKPDYLKSTPLHESVIDGYADYIATGQFPYLEKVTCFIVEKLGLDLSVDQRDNLYTQTFFASHRHRSDKRREHIEKMEEQGWKLLRTIGEAEQLCKDGRKIRALINSRVDWMSTQKDVVLRPIMGGDNRPFFLPPKNSRRGYYVDKFFYPETDETFFYKLL